MKTLSDFQKEFSDLLVQDPFPNHKLQQLLIELNEFIYSAEYERLSFSEKAQVQELLSSMKSKVASEPQPSSEATPPSSDEKPKSRKKTPKSEQEPEVPQHDKNAGELMDEAEERFYAGRYAEAIKLYEQVLKIEPTWERANEHRDQSRKFQLSGEIPSVALPAEAAINYGKAQSAVRVGRYADAKQLYKLTKTVLAQSGITKWNEGQDFEIKLEALIQAENIVRDANEAFNQGKVDDAIQALDSVYKETSIPRHKDLADKYRNFKTIQKQIADIFYSATSASPDIMIQAAQDMEKLSAEFEGNPALQSLRTRFELIKPALTGSLRQEIRNLKAQAERAQSMDQARQHALDAKNHVDLALKLGLTDGMFNTTIREIQQLIADLDTYSQDLEAAESSLRNNKTWPKDAWNISKDVRNRFPNDQVVIKLSKGLSTYRYVNLAIRTVVVAIVLLAFVGLGTWGSRQIRAYNLALTPTATFTATPSLTSTPTNTATPPNTATPSPSPTPTFGRVLRSVWARNGCYEGFTAIGKIPDGSLVNLLPTSEDRRFDALNRECILVEYKGTDNSIIGWILIQDFAP